MLPNYLPTMKFVVRRSGNETSDPLDGLRIQSLDGTRYSRIEQHIPSYLPAGTSGIELLTDAVNDIYMNLFGATSTTQSALSKSDPYSKKVWLKEWMDPGFKKVVLTGNVTHRVKSLVQINGQRAEDKFRVEFENSDVLNEQLRQFGQAVPSEEIMTKGELNSGLSGRWIVPDNVASYQTDEEHGLSFEAMGFTFKVRVGKSEICDGKGLFVAVSCPFQSKPGTKKDVGKKAGRTKGVVTDAATKKLAGKKRLAKSKFVLPKGQYIDFGVYAPHHPGHFKRAVLFDLKSVVTDGRCEDYAWRCEARPEYVYDLSDDKTGDFNEPHSVLAYVNEAKADRQVTMVSEEDKAGAVHYLLGNSDEDISFDVGKSVELTSSYGAMYETVRIRHNYSDAPTNVRDVLESNPYRVAVLEGVGSMDHDTVVEAIDFFAETYRSDLSHLPAEFRDQFFSVILTLHARMRELTPPNLDPPSTRLVEEALGFYDAPTWKQLLRNDLVRPAVQLVGGEALSALINELPQDSLNFRLQDLLRIDKSPKSGC
jgi:hypothetical protein